MAQALFAGVNAAVLTPMRDDLSVDLDRMAAHCRWLLARGCNGLGVLGTTGEANSLGIDERIAVLEGLIERGIDPACLLPGTGTPALTDTVMLSRRAAQLGCRGVLVLPPFFYKSPSDDGLFAYFSEVINRLGDGPAVYLYHFPQQSAVPFSLDLIGRVLRAFPGRLRGIKDSSGDWANTHAMITAFGADGFEVYPADDSQFHAALHAGAAGCITAAANVGSAVSAVVYANRNTKTGADAQAMLTSVRRAVTSVALIPGLKALIARHTGDPAWHTIRPPHLRLPDADAACLFAAFDATGARLTDPAEAA
ncbi:MAG TPA: dihydrodipicolinate synthase family protein [Acidisphaera sp.]|nr:dihydrodipicolinate synthase family protein [Acidisphaera sp.]